MKKILALISVYFLLVGYTFPPECPYIVINSNRGNNEYVYFASNMVEYIHINGNSVISSYSGNLNGFTPSGDNIIFTAYTTPYYRDGYTTINVNITEVVENNLYPTDRSIISKNYELYLIALLGGIAVICFFKK